MTTPTRARSAGRRHALGLLLAVYTCNFMDRQILAVLMPPIKAEFGVSDTFLGLLAGPAFALSPGEDLASWASA